MPKRNWKNNHAAPQTLSQKEIERLENYPDSRRVDLDQVLAESAKEALKKVGERLSV